MIVECNDKTVQDSQKRFVCWQKQLGTASERFRQLSESLETLNIQYSKMRNLSKFSAKLNLGSLQL